MTHKKMIEKDDLEITKAGFSNGISLQLEEKIKHHKSTISLSEIEKKKIINEAAIHFGNFLTSLGVDWENDPNSCDTPTRVAKAYVNDLWRGRYEVLEPITSFPNDGYNGIVLEKDIPVVSLCSHHHQSILGKSHIAYIPDAKNGKVIGLSKLNRIVEHFSRRGCIQEQLTVAIHNALNTILENNLGIIVIIHAHHGCVSCRGVKHIGSSMITSEVSGAFADHTKTAKSEVFSMLGLHLNGFR